MSEKELEAIASEMCMMKDCDLLKAGAQLDGLMSELNLTQAMRRWKAAGNAKKRRRNEELMNISAYARIGSCRIRYERHYLESRRHVYAKEFVYINGKMTPARYIRVLSYACRKIIWFLGIVPQGQ